MAKHQPDASAMTPIDFMMLGASQAAKLNAVDPVLADLFITMMQEWMDATIVPNPETTSVAKRRITREEEAAAGIVVIAAGYAIENSTGQAAAATIDLGVKLAQRFVEYVATSRALEDDASE